MIKNILERIEDLGQQARDTHQDGFTGFGAKRDLYKLKWAIEKEISNTIVYYGEEEWVKDNEPK